MHRGWRRWSIWRFCRDILCLLSCLQMRLHVPTPGGIGLMSREGFIASNSFMAQHDLGLIHVGRKMFALQPLSDPNVWTPDVWRLLSDPCPMAFSVRTKAHLPGGAGGQADLHAFGPFTSSDKFKASVSYVGQLDPTYVCQCLEVVSPVFFPRQITTGMPTSDLQCLWAFVARQFPWDPLPTSYKAHLAPCLLNCNPCMEKTLQTTRHILEVIFGVGRGRMIDLWGKDGGFEMADGDVDQIQVHSRGSWLYVTRCEFNLFLLATLFLMFFLIFEFPIVSSLFLWGKQQLRRPEYDKKIGLFQQAMQVKHEQTIQRKRQKILMLGFKVGKSPSSISRETKL